MPELDWVHLTTAENKRKRPEHVCGVCHGKKIKCDLQARTSSGHTKCSYCDTSGRECRARVPKRAKTKENRTRRQPHEAAAAETLQTLHQSRDHRDTNERSHAHPNGHPEGDTAKAKSGLQNPAFDSGLGRMNEVSPTAMAISYPQPHQHAHHLPPVPPVSQTAFMPRPHSQSITTPPVISQYSQQAGPSPGNRSMASNEQAETGEAAHTGDVDTGFLQIYDLEHSRQVSSHVLNKTLPTPNPLHEVAPLHPDLQQSFIETYFEYAFPFCPVLDRDSIAEELAASPLLAMALALVGSHVNPPLIPHEGPAVYYNKARRLFYEDAEPDTLTSLKAVALFYWWAPMSTAVVQRHSSWWWTSVLIRHAQQMNFHREPGMGDPRRGTLDLSLRRRIWWTAFARERLTALCQSKPCIIDPDDCNIGECTLADFPPDAASQRNGEIFIYWVRLCGIIGRIAKVLSRSAANSKAAVADEGQGGDFPIHLRHELINWVQSLPEHLQLPIKGPRTETFDRAVHQLHLPYLCVLTVLHLKRSSHSLPQALPPAILAASCTARILRDILIRGNSRFLMAITCWYTGTAFVALLQARSVKGLEGVEAELDVLESAVGQLQHMWASANVLVEGFSRLRAKEQGSGTNGASHSHPTGIARNNPSRIGSAVESSISLNPRAISTSQAEEELDWRPFFPFVTSQTNPIAAQLLSNRANGTATRGFPSPSNDVFHEGIMIQYQDLFEPYCHDFSWWTNLPGDDFGTAGIEGPGLEFGGEGHGGPI